MKSGEQPGQNPNSGGLGHRAPVESFYGGMGLPNSVGSYRRQQRRRPRLHIRGRSRDSPASAPWLASRRRPMTACRRVTWAGGSVAWMEARVGDAAAGAVFKPPRYATLRYATLGASRSQPAASGDRHCCESHVECDDNFWRRKTAETTRSFGRLML